jgi:DNA-binding Xre family transcriptional regulator
MSIFLFDTICLQTYSGEYGGSAMRIQDIIVKPKINEVRKSKGITQKELSKKTGIEQGNISKFDKRSSDMYDIRHLIALMDAMDCDLYDLFDIKEKKSD